MDCNRDEALRARQIAERKFLAKDMKGAKKFAIKAQNLYPELDGIAQMVMTLNVYTSSEEEKVQGEYNWYGVLGVTPLADDDTIRKQYRRLALILHPDKNRSMGAEGAFQLVSQAWTVLSDKSKRKAYEQRRVAVSKHRATTKEGPSPPHTQNGFHNFAKTASSQMKPPKVSIDKRDRSHIKEGQTFWTVCHQCKMQYEYLRRYLNHHLLCPNCHEAYFAVEITPPSTKSSRPSSQPSNSHHRKTTSRGNVPNNNDFQWVPFSESNATPSAVQAANMVQQAYEKVKRERQKAQAASRKEKNLASKRTVGAESSRQSNAAKRRKGNEGHVVSKETMKFDTMSFSGHTDIRQLLMERAREKIRSKLNEPIPATKVRDTNGEDFLGKTKENGSICNNQNVIFEQMLVDVPEPDFHDFDKGRTENCFGENQVWAVYDDDDGMPRNYAMIHEVISRNPFKVRMSWLSSVTSFFTSGFSKTCGEFGIGRHETFNSVESFSHKVGYMKSSSTSKTIQIFPRKGDVWALYRNWSSEWNELTEAEVVHKYDVVEVLEDYDEEFGVIVVPLIKVAGYKGVFHQHFNPNEIRRIPKEEMSKFSHQVPSHLLSGQEGVKFIKGCREVDPAATPLEILQTASKVEEIQLLESDNDEIEIVKVIDCDGNTISNIVDGIS